MIVLGIDPGSHRVGFGVVKREGKTHSLISSGVLVPQERSHAASLLAIKEQLRMIIKKSRPNLLAVEKLYFSKNRKTAMAVAEARGVILALAAEEGLKVKEYAPSEIKAGIAGHGRADKRAVAKMVALELGALPRTPYDDMTDALAVALLAAWREGRGAA